MTIHEQDDDIFHRPSPSALSLTGFSFFALLALLQVMSIVVNLCEGLLARAAGWKGSWFFYAPFADSPSTGFFASVPLGSLYELREVIVATVAISIVLLALYLWPSEQKLSNRLAAYSMAIAALTAATAEVASFEALRRVGALTGAGSAAATAVGIALLLILAFLAMLTERRTIELLTNVYTLSTPGRRLIRWIQRLLLPLAVFGGLCAWNGHYAGAIGAGIVLLATFIENVSRVPLEKYQQAKEPLMREAAATSPVIALPLIAAAIYVFGFEALHFQPRAIRYSATKEVELVRIDQLRQPLPTVEGKEPPAPKDKPVIRWSKDRDKKK